MMMMTICSEVPTNQVLNHHKQRFSIYIYISDYEYDSMHTLIIEIVMIFDKRFLAAFSHNHMFVAGMSVL